MSEEKKHRYYYLLDRSLGLLINTSMVLTVAYLAGYMYVRMR